MPGISTTSMFTRNSQQLCVFSLCFPKEAIARALTFQEAVKEPASWALGRFLPVLAASWLPRKGGDGMAVFMLALRSAECVGGPALLPGGGHQMLQAGLSTRAWELMNWQLRW